MYLISQQDNKKIGTTLYHRPKNFGTCKSKRHRTARMRVEGEAPWVTFVGQNYKSHE